MVIDDDFLSTSIHSEMEDGFYLKGGRVSQHSDGDQFNNAVEMLAGRGYGVKRTDDTMNPMMQGLPPPETNPTQVLIISGCH